MNRFNERPGMYVQPTAPDAKKRDQNTAAVGPARIEPEEVVLQVNDRGAIGGGAGTAVQGSFGTVVGLPPGMPYLYVPANLVAFPIDLPAVLPLDEKMGRTATASGSHVVRYDSGKLNVDTQNVIGTSGETIIAVHLSSIGVTSPAIHAYDTISGVASSVALPDILGSEVTCVNNRLVVHRRAASTGVSSITLNVYDGFTVSGVSFAKPAAATGITYYKGSGPSGDGLEVVICWWDQTNSTLYVARYNTSGTIQSYKSVTATTLSVTAGNFTNGNTRIENGYVMYSSTSNVIVTSDDTSSSTWRVLPVAGPGQPNMCIGSTGIGWIVTATTPTPSADINVHRFNFVTGVTENFIQALTGFVSPNDPVATNVTATQGITYISDTKFGVCSGYYDPIAGTMEPIYITVAYTPGTPGTLSLSQLRFSAYAAATTYPASTDVIQQFTFGPVTVGNNVVFTLQADGPSTGGSGLLEFMWRVAA